MKKILILSILSIFLLSGCSSIYNLNNFILPDDIEFLSLIQELDTPQEVCQYMLDNFTYEAHFGKPLDPYQLYLLKKGDCDDFASWGQFFANYHGCETYSIIIKYSNYSSNHCIAIYNFNGYLHFSDNQYYLSTGYFGFKDIVIFDTFLYHPDKTWSSFIVYDYNMNVIEQGIK